MKAPTVETLWKSLPEGHQVTEEEVAAGINWATPELETRTETPIRRREIEETLFLRDRVEPVRLFPIHDVKVNDRETPYSGSTGILYPDALEPANYQVTYVVGYDEKSLPAIVAKALFHLVRHRLLGLVEDYEEAEATIAIIKLGVQKNKKERERELAEAGKRGGKSP